MDERMNMERIRMPEIIKNKIASKTRIHLEDDIMAAWGTKEDLEQFIRLLMDIPNVALDENDVLNYVDAIKTMHDMRMQVLMDTFTQVHHLDGYGTLAEVLACDEEQEDASVKKKKGKKK